MVFDCPHTDPHSLRMDFQALVAKILLAREETQADLARRLNVTQPTISRWKSGKQKPEPEEKAALIAEAQNLGIMEANEATSTIPIVGLVGSGGEVQPEPIVNSGGGRTEMPPNAARDTVALRVRDDSMLPFAGNGWIFYYRDHKERPTEEMVGRLCVVSLHDGRMLVRRLYRGRSSDTWDLHAATAPPMLDQQLDWACPITWIKPV